ncbi:MAG: cytochrome c3 family protein [Pyrinomonadaceae bacterium]
MKTRILVILVMTLTCLMVTVAYNTAPSPLPSTMLAKGEAPLDGANPPHAVDIAGKTIPDSSATQPDKPIILSKDSNDPKWGELKPEAAFDHTKHHDVTHTLDGKTATACVYCHHTEQPMPVAAQPYLKKSERTAVLTAAQLETSKQPVNSCRHCHFQEATAATDESPPKSVKYPREMGLPPSGKLTNDVAYHLRCMGCHDVAMKRDPKLKAPQACGDCHVKKT